MAMATWLQLVTDKEIALLVREPARINKLDNEGTNTYWSQTISYFLCGDAWPSASRRKPLTAMFFGHETVDTPTLENGNFGIVRPGDIKAIAVALANVDLDKLRSQVEEANPSELEEAECDDFEFLTSDDDNPGQTIVENVKALRAFYEKARKLGRGVVMYTT